MVYSTRKSLEQLRTDGMEAHYIICRENMGPCLVRLEGIGNNFNEAYEQVMSRCDEYQTQLDPKVKKHLVGICDAKALNGRIYCRVTGKLIGIKLNADHQEHDNQTI